MKSESVNIRSQMPIFNNRNSLAIVNERKLAQPYKINTSVTTAAKKDSSISSLLGRIADIFSEIVKSPKQRQEEKQMEYAFGLTARFEAKGYDTIQTKDSGIISYGLHQSTLASGSLEKVLNAYLDTTDSDVATYLRSYMDRVAVKDISLRKDSGFLKLLKLAGMEEAMIDAQNKVFVDVYWKPAYSLANDLGIKSDIGVAILYDTNVQGGLRKILNSTIVEFAGKEEIGEKEFLSEFLKNRREYLLKVAGRKDRITAQMLENSAKNRVGFLENLLQSF